MITYPSAGAADKRVSFTRHRIENEGIVWFVTGRYDPTTGKLKVTRLDGDINHPRELEDACLNFAASISLAIKLKQDQPPPAVKRGRPRKV